MKELKIPTLDLKMRRRCRGMCSAIGYVTVPWKRRQGCATAALLAVLPPARALGLPYVEITEPFTKPDAYGNAPGLRFRIAL